MFMLKSTIHKGLTLIEVIVAVALVSMVTSFLLINLSRSYAMLASAKGLTSDIFSLVQDMELEIQDTQMSLAEGVTPGAMQTFTLFAGETVETSVAAYRVENNATENSNWEFFAYVPEKGIPALPVPEITQLGIGFYNGNSERVSYLNPELTARRNNFQYQDPEQVYSGSSTHQWYISREGFTAVNYDNRDKYHERLFPIFPKDYQLITADGNSLSLSAITEEYKGRHLLLIARPVAVSGKMGARYVSQPIYLSALPIDLSSPLYFHFDTGMIDQEIEDTESVPITRWKDLQENTWDAPFGANRPTLSIGEAGTVSSDDGLETVFVQHLTFTGQPMKTTIRQATPQALTVIALVRRTSAGSAPLDVLDINGDVLSLIEDPSAEKSWQIVSGFLFPQEDDTTVVQVGVDAQDLLEVIAYEGMLSTEEEIQVRDYLLRKYGLL